jgi:hypothetical protein
VILSLILALVAEPAAAVAPANTEASCSLLVYQDGKPGMVAAPGFKVMGGPDQLAPAVPAGGVLKGVMCHRASIVPDARDDRVFRQLSVPLFIATGTITGALRFADGHFAYAAVDGAWNTEIQPQIDAVVAGFNARLGG